MKKFLIAKCAVKYFLRVLLYPSEKEYIQKKMFKCKTPINIFSLSFILSTHMRAFIGYNPYDFMIFTKAFLQNSILSTHMKVMKPQPPQEILFLPTHYGKIQTSQGDLEHSTRKHNSYILT